ncbi:unnamed protein product, partial [Closterium sp. NIES-53]
GSTDQQGSDTKGIVERAIATPSMAPHTLPIPIPLEEMRREVGHIAVTHRTPHVSISRHLQEPIALLRSGATLLFDGRQTATCGDLMYTLAAPRLTKRLMSIAANAGDKARRANHLRAPAKQEFFFNEEGILQTVTGFNNGGPLRGDVFTHLKAS